MAVTYSVVIPVYGNEGSILALIDRVAELQDGLGSPVEAVFVVDGSPDQSYELLRRHLPTAPFPSRLTLLSRNFGAFAAIRVGLGQASGSVIATMSADLQEPLDLIHRFLVELTGGDTDIVIGVRTGREDSLRARIGARVFWGLYRRLVMPEIPTGGVDVFGCTAEIRDQLLRLTETRSSLVAQLFWIGFRRMEVPYQRQPRHSGKSAWNLGKKLRYLSDSVFAFTDLPIRLLTISGLAGLVVSVALGSLVLIGRILSWFTAPGYTVTVELILLFGSLNLLGLGLVGSYAWRSYENTKSRPEAIPMVSESFGERSM